MRKSRPRAESSNCAAVFAHLNLQQLSQRPRLHEDKLIQGHAQNVDRWNGKRNDCNLSRQQRYFVNRLFPSDLQGYAPS